MRVTGVEPARRRHQILSLARLPFRHARRGYVLLLWVRGVGDPPKARTPDALVTDSLPATHPGCLNHVAYHSMGRRGCQEENSHVKEKDAHAIL